MQCQILLFNKLADDNCMPQVTMVLFPILKSSNGVEHYAHKKNPDVWELLGYTAIGCRVCQTIAMTTNIPHGYHRDYQLLKGFFSSY